MLNTYNKFFLLLGISACAGSTPLHAAGPITTMKSVFQDHTSNRHDLAHKRHIYTTKHTVYKYGQLLSLMASGGCLAKMAHSLRHKPILKKDLGIMTGSVLTNLFFMWKKSSLEASLPALEAAERHARDADALRLQQKQEREAQLAQKERKKQEDIQLEHERAEREAQKAREAEEKTKLDAAAQLLAQKEIARLQEIALDEQRYKEREADFQRKAKDRDAEKKRNLDALKTLGRAALAALNPAQRADIENMRMIDLEIQKLSTDQQATLQAGWHIAEKLRQNASYSLSQEEQDVEKKIHILAKELLNNLFRDPSKQQITEVLFAMLMHYGHFKKKLDQQKLCCAYFVKKKSGHVQLADLLRKEQTVHITQRRGRDSVTPGLQQLLADKYLNPARYTKEMEYAGYL